MREQIYLSLAHMSGYEQEFIAEAFRTNWVVPLGPNVDAFEKDLSLYLGNARPVVALSSGTAAIHLALLLSGVKAGDEVICQSFTFAASAYPIVYQQATPIFVDSESDTWNMDPHWFRKAIEDRLEKTGKVPKAVIPVHLYGMPAQMDEIGSIAEEYGLIVIEDAAEALGSEYKGIKCGTFGRLAALSFNGNKIIATSGGGALICRTPEDVRETIFYSTQARDDAPYYQHSRIGYNYRMSNICAGIGRGQMKVLDQHVTRRRRIHDLYKELFSGVEGLTIQENPSPDYHSNFWLTCILLDPEVTGVTPEMARQYLAGHGIESRPLWKPMHLQPVFSASPFYGDGTAERLFETGLCLPSGSALTDEQIRYVAECLMTCMEENKKNPVRVKDYDLVY